MTNIPILDYLKKIKNKDFILKHIKVNNKNIVIFGESHSGELSKSSSKPNLYNIIQKSNDIITLVESSYIYNSMDKKQLEKTLKDKNKKGTYKDSYIYNFALNFAKNKNNNKDIYFVDPRPRADKYIELENLYNKQKEEYKNISDEKKKKYLSQRINQDSIYKFFYSNNYVDNIIKYDKDIYNKIINRELNHFYRVLNSFKKYPNLYNELYNKLYGLKNVFTKTEDLNLVFLRKSRFRIITLLFLDMILLNYILNDKNDNQVYFVIVGAYHTINLEHYLSKIGGKVIYNYIPKNIQFNEIKNYLNRKILITGGKKTKRKSYDKMTVKELKNKCKQKKIKGYSNLNKKELIKKLRR
jgi:hypothetical protein